MLAIVLTLRSVVEEHNQPYGVDTDDTLELCTTSKSINFNTSASRNPLERGLILRLHFGVIAL